MKNKLSSEIKHIMSAKNFNQEQAANFLMCYKNTKENISLYEFIQKKGGISPVISTEILKSINK